MRTILLALGLALGLLAGGCAKSDAPDDPVWGKQACAECAMLVSDKRYAAEIVAGGERRYFDDVGCMATYLQGHPNEVASAWVRDSQTGHWIDARTAHYAQGAATPMDYGFEARADGALRWDAVLARAARRSTKERNP